MATKQVKTSKPVVEVMRQRQPALFGAVVQPHPPSPSFHQLFFLLCQTGQAGQFSHPHPLLPPFLPFLLNEHARHLLILLISLVVLASLLRCAPMVAPILGSLIQLGSCSIGTDQYGAFFIEE